MGGLELDFGWMVDHLDDLAYRTVQHLTLTGLAVGIGFVVSLGLAIVAVRRRRSYTGILAFSDILYTIPSLALFAALVSVTGISLTTVLVPLVAYTLTIFVRNIAAGIDGVPDDVIEAASGLGMDGRQRLIHVELPLAVPLIVAGLRLASVSTIGLVTVTSIMGDAFGGLGYFILEGYRRSFPTELYFGAVPSILLAFVVDWLLLRLQRAITPWTRARAVSEAEATTQLQRPAP
jgi:osmoprotectant transport system permease protein